MLFVYDHHDQGWTGTKKSGLAFLLQVYIVHAHMFLGSFLVGLQHVTINKSYTLLAVAHGQSKWAAVSTFSADAQ